MKNVYVVRDWNDPTHADFDCCEKSFDCYEDAVKFADELIEESRKEYPGSYTETTATIDTPLQYDGDLVVYNKVLYNAKGYSLRQVAIINYSYK